MESQHALPSLFLSQSGQAVEMESKERGTSSSLPTLLLLQMNRLTGKQEMVESEAVLFCSPSKKGSDQGRTAVFHCAPPPEFSHLLSKEGGQSTGSGGWVGRGVGEVVGKPRTALVHSLVPAALPHGWSAPACHEKKVALSFLIISFYTK